MRRALLTFGIVLCGLAAWFSQAGSLLIAEDEPTHADAIVVLGGNTPVRLPYAEQLRAQGFATLLVVSNERVHTHGLETTWLALHRAGVAAPEISDSDLLVIDDPPPESTLDEARRAADMLAARGLRSALVVTDAFHSRRARLLFAAAFGHKGMSIRSTPVSDRFDLAHWWLHPLSARRVAEEWTKLALYLIEGAYW